MNFINLHDLQLFMLAAMFLLGCITFLSGISILMLGAWGRDLRAITAQTSQLAQKGLADEISGLVGNASALLNAINDMARTTTGIGVFLTISGGLIMSITCWIAFQIP